MKRWQCAVLFFIFTCCLKKQQARQGLVYISICYGDNCYSSYAEMAAASTANGVNHGCTALTIAKVLTQLTVLT